MSKGSGGGGAAKPQAAAPSPAPAQPSPAGATTPPARDPAIFATALETARSVYANKLTLSYDEIESRIMGLKVNREEAQRLYFGVGLVVAPAPSASIRSVLREISNHVVTQKQYYDMTQFR